MPVGTKGAVKTLSSDDLKKLNAQIVLSNTYHLYLRPGEKLIKKMGGLHKWINWNKPILTDSGGFQVFSLGQSPKAPLVKIHEDGVEFRSHLNGSRHYFTPEKAIKIQNDLGADIIMAFDECAPAKSSKKYFKQAMERTHKWAERCKKAHKSRKQALFGIVQGGTYKDLRTQSAKFINSLDFPGNAIGGLSVGEDKKTMHKMIAATVPYLDPKKPRYLMGVGTPEDLLRAIKNGIDMFDCVLPTRLARHGTFWTKRGSFSIKNTKFKADKNSLEKNCPCEACQGYSRSYIRHLFTENEISALRLLTIHNLHFLLNFMQEIRTKIKNDKI